MTKKRRSKSCRECGAQFIENYGESESQWINRRFCSTKCVSIHFAAIRTKPIFDRLEENQLRYGAENCWGWAGTKDLRGYGVLSGRSGRASKKRKEKAHRVSYEKANGPIPDGLVVRHKCDNPECTNPNHLEIGTQKDNMRDMVARKRHNPASNSNLNHQPALSKEQVEFIKSMRFVAKNGRGSGVKKRDLAKQLGVCEDTIRAALKGDYIGY